MESNSVPKVDFESVLVRDLVLERDAFVALAQTV